MDFEEALEILGVTKSSNFDSFRLDISRNWKKLLIKYQGKNDKELSRVNRAYDLLKRISNDEFDKIFDDEIIENDIFIEDTNEDLFSEENNSSNVTYGIDTDVIEDNNEDLFSEENNLDTDEMGESFERFRLERLENSQELDQELNDGINSEIQFDLSKTYIFNPDEKFNLLRVGVGITGFLLGSGGPAGLASGEFYVSVSKKGIEWKMPSAKFFYPYELIKKISNTNKGVGLDLFKRYKFLKKHVITCYGNNDELYECINFFYLNYKNDFNSKYIED